MNNETIFRLITLAVLVVILSISSYFRIKADRQSRQMRTPEGQGLVVILRLLGLVVILPLLGYVINPEWVRWARFSLPEWVRWLAVFVAFALIPMIYWIFVSLGNNISPTQATRANHQLVTHGPYRWVRHPLYSTGFVLAVCLTLITGLWWLAVGTIVPLTILLLRTAQEEARLVETFGDAYRAYMKRTGRFWPKLAGQNSDEQHPQVSGR
jgi:protein-S-isoprenylcysteine O-methyltransferase Ste14